ncbi:MAG: hypothetical protein KDK10_14185 [Maritimibacter sp.]|nr:hypothetical protein [Maritimibacter sp.]
MPRILTLALLLGLAACTAVNPLTLGRLAALDFLTVDPASLAARIETPPGFGIPEGAAAISVVSERSDTGQKISERLPLGRTGDLWRLAPAEAARLRDLQGRIRLWEAEAPKANTGAITLSLAGCLEDPALDLTQTVNADISTDGGQTFLPFLRDLAVADILEEAEKSAVAMRCD